MNLREIPFFKNLDESELKRLAEISSLKRYKADEIVFFEGEMSKFLLVLIEGVVRLYKNSSKGKEIVLNTISPISFIAEVANLEQIPYPASCVFSAGGGGRN